MPPINKMNCKTACCCYVCSPCYIDFPDCLACQIIDNCLCFESMVHCGIFEQSCRQRCCKEFTCCKSSVQCCFVVEACAIPCDKDVPFMIGLCGVMCKDGPEEWKNAVPAQQAQTVVVVQQTGAPVQQQMVQQQPQYGRA